MKGVAWEMGGTLTPGVSRGTWKQPFGRSLKTNASTNRLRSTHRAVGRTELAISREKPVGGRGAIMVS